MARYRKIDPRIWNDEKFVSLSPEEKLLAIYAITAQSNRCGIFFFSPALAIEQTGMVSDSYAIAIFKVVEALKWVYDSSKKVLFLPTWWRYNPPENPNHLKGCLEDIHEVPQTELLQHFWENETYIPEHSILMFRKVRDSYGIAMAYQKQKQKQKQKQNKGEKSGTISLSADADLFPQIRPEEFLSIWNQFVPFAAIRDMTSRRVRALVARARDPAFFADWRTAIAKIPQSPFLRGENDRGWKVNADFFLQPDSLTKILEGKYDGKPSNGIHVDQNSKLGRIKPAEGKYSRASLFANQQPTGSADSAGPAPQQRSDSDELPKGTP